MNVVEILDKLVAFDTTSHLSNRPLTAWIESYLKSLGVQCEIVPSESEDKDALMAVIGPRVEGGVVLSGHSDVVPVTNQKWTTSPFKLRQSDGRLIARGTSDMKGFIACILAAVPQMLAADLKRPFIIAVSYDEEVGCLGVRPLVQRILSSVPTPAAAIIGEPTELQVIDRHLGAYAQTTDFVGRPGHSSRPEKFVNAIDYCLAYAARLQDGIAQAQSKCRGRISLNLGRIEGGSSSNTVAGDARLVWSLRCDSARILEHFLAHAETAATTTHDALQAAHPDCGLGRSEAVYIPALEPSPDNPLVAQCLRLTGSNATAEVYYGSEAGIFQQAGLDTVVCGPGKIDQAHTEDEYVESSQLAAYDAFLGRLIAECC